MVRGEILMIFYQKQMILLTSILILFIFLGLFVVYVNMEKTTIRNEQDFILFTSSGDGLWEVRFLGSSLFIDKKAIEVKISAAGSNLVSQARKYGEDGYVFIQKTADYFMDKYTQMK
jgi:hypothetical protein